MKRFNHLPKFAYLAILGSVLAAISPIMDASAPPSEAKENIGHEANARQLPAQDDVLSLLDEAKRLNQIFDIPAKPKINAGMQKVKRATPVPWREGFVFSPGMAHVMANVLDVRGLPSGVEAVDPETGRAFIVP